MADEHIRLENKGGGSGSHSAYFDGYNRLTIEWYDFGKDTPYSSANMLIFEETQAGELSRSIGFEGTFEDRTGLLNKIHEKFDSYFEALDYIESNNIGFIKKVDFNP